MIWPLGEAIPENAAKVSRELADTVAGLQARLALVEARLASLEAPAAKREELVGLSSEGTTVAASDLGAPSATSVMVKEESQMLDYQLGNTLWDAPAFIGLKDMGGLELSGILLTSTLLNAAAQLYLVWVLMDSDSFIRQDKWQRLKLSTQRWRDNEAHQYSQIDAGGTSLAARVCGLDDALSIAGKQSGMLVEINNYVGLEGSNFGEATRFPTGPWLCTVCLFLWIVVIVRELRQLATYLVAMLSLPRGGHTRFEDGQLMRISRPRAAFVLVMALVRLVVALALCYAGVMWLAHTSSVVDLILNAAALTFVMDLDELLLETTVPAVVHRFVAELKPVRYKSPIFYIEALVPMALVFTMVVTSVTLLVFPNMEAMRSVKREMCEGLVDFAVDQNGAGFAAVLMTTPFMNSSSAEAQGIKEKAVRDLRTRHGKEDTVLTVTSNYSFISATEDSFRSFTAISREDFSSGGACFDKDIVAKGQRKIQRPFWFTTVTAQTVGVHGHGAYNATAWRCRDYFEYCDTVALVRAICPKVCGVDNVLSGQIYNSPKMGILQPCLDSINTTAKAGAACEDAAERLPAEWERWWLAYRAAHIFKNPRRKGDPVFESFIKSKIEKGCNDTATDPYMKHGFCSDDAVFLKASSIRSPRAFCLKSCCRMTQGPDCPASCGPP